MLSSCSSLILSGTRLVIDETGIITTCDIIKDPKNSTALLKSTNNPEKCKARLKSQGYKTINPQKMFPVYDNTTGIGAIILIYKGPDDETSQSPSIKVIKRANFLFKAFYNESILQAKTIRTDFIQDLDNNLVDEEVKIRTTEFIKLNTIALMEYWDGKIDEAIFMNRITKLK